MAREFRIEEIRISTNRREDFGIARPMGSGRPVRFKARHGLLQMNDIATGRIINGELILNERLRPSGTGTFGRTWAGLTIYL